MFFTDDSSSRTPEVLPAQSNTISSPKSSQDNEEKSLKQRKTKSVEQSTVGSTPVENKSCLNQNEKTFDAENKLSTKAHTTSSLNSDTSKPPCFSFSQQYETTSHLTSQPQSTQQSPSKLNGTRSRSKSPSKTHHSNTSSRSKSTSNMHNKISQPKCASNSTRHNGIPKSQSNTNNNGSQSPESSSHTEINIKSTAYLSFPSPKEVETSKIHNLASDGDVQGLQICIGENPKDVDLSLSEGSLPLHCATEKNQEGKFNN